MSEDKEKSAPEEEEIDKSTMDYAVDLVHHSGQTYDDLKIRSLGLSLTLLGLAEVQSDRVRMLSGVVKHLEQEVFSEQALREYEPREMLNLHKVANDALNESYSYIKQVVDKTDWSKIEGDLVAVQTRRTIEVGGDDEMAKVAGKVLEMMRGAKKKLVHPSEEEVLDE